MYSGLNKYYFLSDKYFHMIIAGACSTCIPSDCPAETYCCLFSVFCLIINSKAAVCAGVIKRASVILVDTPGRTIGGIVKGTAKI